MNEDVRRKILVSFDLVCIQPGVFLVFIFREIIKLCSNDNYWTITSVRALLALVNECETLDNVTSRAT